MAKMPTWAIVLSSITGCGCLGVLGLGGLGLFGLQKGKEYLSKTTQEAAADGRLLRLEEAKIAQINGQPAVVGMIRNPTNKTFLTATLELALMDKAGQPVGSTRAFSEKNIAPNSVWTFQAPIDEPNAARVSAGPISAFAYKPEYDKMESEKLLKLRFQLGSSDLSKVTDLLNGKKVDFEGKSKAR